MSLHEKIITAREGSPELSLELAVGLGHISEGSILVGSSQELLYVIAPDEDLEIPNYTQSVVAALSILPDIRFTLIDQGRYHTMRAQGFEVSARSMPLAVCGMIALLHASNDIRAAS